jgi:3-deoxy-D-manno-octulosonate 8-phosphate phosphatase (KDO 8-P phosphatase)
VAHVIKAVALDVDGTLTDGAIYWSANGDEFKRFHFLDIMGIARAQRCCGIRFALISGEDSPLVDRFAGKLGITALFKGCKAKGDALREAAKLFSLDPSEFAFMGDDVNDLPALRLAGFKAAPLTAHPSVLREVDFVSLRAAGSGAVRCLIDHLWGEAINREPAANLGTDTGIMHL